MTKRFLLLAGSAGLSLLSAPAWANTPPADEAATTDATSGAGAADAADQDQDSLSNPNTIVVTARRREETAQDVPLAISVIRADSIESTGNFNVQKLQQLAPALQVYSQNARNTSVNIRGLGVPFGLTSDGFEQGVGIYVDDVYNSRVAAAVFDFNDVAQVEVLRGPQGTLYGKNTTAGAINITTNQPTFNWEGRAELSVGNYGFKQGKAAISGPLSDTIAARIAVSSTSRNGTVFNTTTLRGTNEQDNFGIRGQLLFKPNADLSITLAGDYSSQNPECCSTVFVRVGATQRPLNRQYAALAAAARNGAGYAPPSTNPFDRLTDNDAELNAGNKIGGLSLKVAWDLGPGTLTSITAWRFWDWKPANDRDYTGLSIVSRSQNPSQQDQYSQELRYNFTGEKFDGVIGAFFFKQRIDTQGTESQGADASKWVLTPGSAVANDPSVLNGLTARNTQYLKSTSAALYGQLAWKVTDALTIQPGLRLNYDKKSGFYQRRVFTGANVELLASQCFPAPSSTTVIGAQCSVYQPQLSSPSVSDWNFSYDLNISYKLDRDILAYATYAKSFKTVGINQNGLPVDNNGNVLTAAGTVKPESVNHFEVGLKTQFWDRKVTFNVAAFRTNIKNFQVTVNNGQFGVVRGYLANADKVRTQGIEADLSVRPSERITLYGSAAYTDAKYKRFVDAPCPPERAGGTALPIDGNGNVVGTPAADGTPGNSRPFCNISGQRLPGVSKLAVSYGAEVNVPVTLLAKEGQAYLGVDGSYRSAFSSNPAPSAYTWVKGYALTNFRLGFRGEGLDVYGWVRNAFNVGYFDQLIVASGNTGLVAGVLGDPRTYGLTIKGSF